MPQYIENILTVKGKRVVRYRYNSYFYEGYEFRDFCGDVNWGRQWDTFKDLDVLVLDYTENQMLDEEYLESSGYRSAPKSQHSVIKHRLTDEQKKKINVIIITKSNDADDHLLVMYGYNKFGSVMFVDKFNVDEWIKNHEA